jgi:hypothetical protein
MIPSPVKAETELERLDRVDCIEKMGSEHRVNGSQNKQEVQHCQCLREDQLLKLLKARDLKDPKDALNDLYDSFFAAIGVICLLGATVSFNALVIPLAPPAQQGKNIPQLHFSEATVRRFLAVGWLLFTVGLGLSFGLAAWLKMKTRKGIFSKDNGWTKYHQRVNLMLYPLLLAGLVLLALVVTAYEEVVGTIAFGLIGIVLVLFIYYQAGQFRVNLRNRQQNLQAAPA